MAAARARALRATRPPPRAGGRDPIVAAVGPATARALAKKGWPPTVVPADDDQRQEGLRRRARGAARRARGSCFRRRSAGASMLRGDARRRAAWSSTSCPSPRPCPSTDLPPLPTFDAATFASPSALRAFVERWGAVALARTAVAVIGPTTAAAARQVGVTVAARSGVADSRGVASTRSGAAGRSAPPAGRLGARTGCAGLERLAAGNRSSSRACMLGRSVAEQLGLRAAVAARSSAACPTPPTARARWSPRTDDRTAPPFSLPSFARSSASRRNATRFSPA